MPANRGRTDATAEDADGSRVADDGACWAKSYPPTPDAPREARLGVEEWLCAARLPGPAIASVLVVVSELVANGVRHARTEVVVTATRRDGAVRIEVVDRDIRPPALLGLDAESTSGRGLHLVASLARDWGWCTAEMNDGGAGKVVWAEVPTDERR